MHLPAGPNTYTFKHFFSFLAITLKKFSYICLNMKTSTFHIAAMIRLRQDVKWKMCARDITMSVR